MLNETAFQKEIFGGAVFDAVCRRLVRCMLNRYQKSRFQQSSLKTLAYTEFHF